MAIAFLQKNKKQKYLILVLFIMLISIAVIWWFALFKEEAPVAPDVGIIPTRRKADIDFQVLESPELKNLQPFQEIAPLEGTPGRENPFIPY